MKKSLSAFLAVSAFTFGISQTTLGQQAPANVLDWNEVLTQLLVDDAAPLNVIEWKVGDTMEYNISMAGLGNLGKSTKSVTKDEGEALWMRQAMALFGHNEVIDILLRKADGKVLKMIRNGQEQQIPDDPIEIISQDYARVTVPAGTFDAMHIVAKTRQVSRIEVWMNPRDTVMDGTLKQIASTQFGNMTLELQSFRHGQ